MGEVLSINPRLKDMSRDDLFKEAIFWGIAEKAARIDFQTPRDRLNISLTEIEEMTRGTSERLQMLPVDKRDQAIKTIMKITTNYPGK